MSGRLGYLDSVRGLAASSVVLGHFAGCYATFLTAAPFAVMVLGQRPWLSPILLAEDSDTAVCLFFVLSGFVLTKVFAKYLGAPAATLTGRAVRLFLPGLCACIFGFLVFLVTPHPAGAAPLAHWTNVVKDAFVSMPLLGYEGQSIFDQLPFISSFVAAPSSALDQPLWSLSVEWQGSLLIYALIGLRSRQRRLWTAVICALGLLLLRDWLVCFLFGHLVAVYSEPLSRLTWRPSTRRIIAGVSLALGLFICLLAAANIVGPFGNLIAANLPLPSCNDPTDAMRLYAAMLIFAGVFTLTELHPSLEHPFLAWLGRMSFPIYLTHFPIVYWVVPLTFRHLPFWFWVPNPASLAINPEIEYPRVIIGSFVAMIVMTLMAATVFLAIDRSAISAGHKLRAYMLEVRPEKRSAFRHFR
jgi:peptidoglycan/LPS O-acetylase OafA/YrhL